MSRDREHRLLCSAIAEARTAAGLTQRELSLRMKRSHSYIGKIEAGERRLDVIAFIEIARALRLDPRDLLDRIVS